MKLADRNEPETAGAHDPVLGLLFIRRTGRKMDILEAGQVHGGMRRAYDRPEG